VRSLGAAHVVDYTKADFTAADFTAADRTGGRTRYDVILDNVGNRPLRRLRQALAPTGTLVFNAGGSPGGRLFGPVGAGLQVAVANGFARQRLRVLGFVQERADLLAVTRLIEAGQLAPVLDRTYPLASAAEGVRYVETGHARGKAVITVT